MYTQVEIVNHFPPVSCPHATLSSRTSLPIYSSRTKPHYILKSSQTDKTNAILILHAAPLLRAELMRSPRVQFDTSQVHLRRLKFDYGTKHKAL